MRSIRKKKII